jgi:outer membrane lipoprotein carrier protein
MKKIFTTLLMAAVVVSAGAQKPTSSNPVNNDPAAKKILDAVSAKFRTYKSAQASFTYLIENAQGKVLSTKKGTVAMRGSKYHVTIPGMEIFSDGRLSWNYDKAAKEVTIKDADGSGEELTPQKLFTNFYDKDFLYKLNGEKKEGGKVLQEIEMTPSNKSRPFHKVYVWVDKATNTIYRTRILEKSGTRYVYTINSFKPNVNIPDATFTFDKKKYPGVEVVDLR